MTFFITLLTIFYGADFFVWVRGVQTMKRNGVRPALIKLFHAFMLAQVLGIAAIVAGRLLEIRMDTILPLAILIPIFLWHLLVLPIALSANLLGVLADGVKALFKWIGFPRKTIPTAEPTPASESPLPPSTGVTRREFLGAAAVFTPPILTLALSATASQQIANFRVRPIDIALPQLPKELDGLTIAQLSDTHLGRFTHGKVVRRIAEQTNLLKADLVTFTGDLINDSLTWLPEAIDMLKAIDAPLVVCEGNHDLIDDGPEFHNQMKAAGLTLLVNEATTLPLRGFPVQLLGLPWSGPSNYRNRTEGPLSESVQSILPLRDPAAFSILLAHHPHAWDYAGDIPLTLAGHTHGGQLMLNERMGIGPAMFRYWTGLYNRPITGATTAKSQALVVSNGTGNWFPLRVAAPAEILHITLRRA
jgi:predicted MPP superfamily phosphohydrolase